MNARSFRDEAHGLFVDRCSSLDHRDNQPDHQHDYQRGPATIMITQSAWPIEAEKGL
jgi:hypothetical protein